MPITYTGNITQIQNGQAINATNLNAPSVDLELRTQEIKRDSDQTLFSHAHTSEASVVLTSDTPASAKITIRTILKEDGSANNQLVKYYTPLLSDLSFSIYAKAVHGGRYIIPGDAIDSLYNASNDGTNSVLSTALSVPGDGIFAKVPLRHTSQGDLDTTEYPDTVYPKTRAQSIGTQYFDEAPSLEVVKLPQRLIMDLEAAADSGETPDTFITSLGTYFPGYTFSVAQDTGALSIVNSNDNSVVTLRVNGTLEGARCHVTHILSRGSDNPGVQLLFSEASCPLYTLHEAAESTQALSLGLYDATGTLVVEENDPFDALIYPGYHIIPKRLEAEFSYVPLILLTENSLRVAGREIPLAPRTLVNGTQINVHGDPSMGIGSFEAEDILEYSISILGDNRTDLEYKKRYSVDLGSHTVSNGILNTAASSLTLPDLAYISSQMQLGDKIVVQGVEIYTHDSFTTSSGSPSWEATAKVTSGDNHTLSADINLTAAPSTGDLITLMFDEAITLSVQDPDSLSVGIRVRDGSSQLLTGSITAKVELQVI